ncbi:hypothetical protein P7C70_g7914, partial [Phenoliferia sp. Uapishka_3]
MAQLRFSAFEPDKSKRGPLRSDADNVKTPVKQLYLEAQQRSELLSVYNGRPNHNVREFRVNAPGFPPHPDQLAATALLAHYELDEKSVEDLAHPWTARWMDSWGKKLEKRKRVLFQCACGYYSPARTSRKEGQDGIRNEDRKCGYNFTGCLAHADVVFRECDRAVLRISGIFKHNASCVDAKLVRRPAIPLHPHVYEVALAQLSEGADLTAVQERNTAYINEGKYRDIASFNPKTSNWRYEIIPTDNKTLYRQHYRSIGIDWSKIPEFNIDAWLDKQSDSFKSELSAAITGYHPRTEEHDRFQLIIQTDDMKTSAWKHGHQKQIIMDGTFGVCSSKILVFITMAIDHEGHGVPLAFMLFSPPPKNRATQAGYDTHILTELLASWKESLGVNRLGESFRPKLAITDTDSKERGALNAVFPGIILRLCRYHLRQCWKNHLNKHLRGEKSLDSPVSRRGGRRKHSFEREAVRKSVKHLQEAILTAPTLPSAKSLLLSLHTSLQTQASTTKSAYSAPAQSAIKHLDYLSKEWLKPEMFESFSDAGRVAAATFLGTSVSEVANTSNHLECLNGLLKNKHLSRYKRGGRRIRLDLLIFLLVHKILPSIFGERQKQRTYRANANARFFEAAGNVALGPQRTRLASTERLGDAAWISLESEVAEAHRVGAPNLRDEGARTLLLRGFVLPPYLPSGDPSHITVGVISSTSIPPPAGQEWIVQPTIYVVNLRPIAPSDASPSLTFADCNCADFKSRRLACSHIRAALLKYRSNPHAPILPPLPSSAVAGRALGDLVTSLLRPLPPPPSLLLAPTLPTPSAPALVRTLAEALPALATDGSSDSEEDSGSDSSSSDSDSSSEGEVPIPSVSYIPPPSAATSNHIAVIHQTQSRLEQAAEKARMALLTCIEIAREAPSELDLSSLSASVNLAELLAALVVSSAGTATPSGSGIAPPLPPSHTSFSMSSASIPSPTLPFTPAPRPALGNISNKRPRVILPVERERASKRKEGTVTL